MPQYYNPYTFYPSYQQPVYSGGYSGAAYTVMPQQPVQNMMDTELVMKWVDGEVAAKAFNRPQGWPENRPIPLWDSTDTVIWLKSWGPMGIPNPMQKLKYIMPDQQSQAFLQAGQNMSGAQESTASQIDTSNFATKDDIASLREEVRQMAQRNVSRNMTQDRNNYNASANQNGSVQGGQNRGGNQ